MADCGSVAVTITPPSTATYCSCCLINSYGTLSHVCGGTAFRFRRRKSESGLKRIIMSKRELVNALIARSTKPKRNVRRRP